MSYSIDRPLTKQENQFLAQYNIGVHRVLFSSARYQNASLSMTEGTAKIQETVDVLINHIPILSSIIVIDHSTKAHALARPKLKPVVKVKVVTGVDLDLASESHKTWSSKILDIPVEHSGAPLWHVYLLQAPSQSFDGRVVFVYSHTLMDGLSGPLWQRSFAEILANPDHPYRKMDAYETLKTPGLDTLWDLGDDGTSSKGEGWLAFFKRLGQHIYQQFFGPAHFAPVYPTILKTNVFSRRTMDELLAAGRLHGVTMTNILDACALYALTLVKPHKAGVKTDTAATLRPGYPTSKGFAPGSCHDIFTRRDSELKADSAFNQLLFCAPSGFIRKLKVSGDESFWDLCRGHQTLLQGRATLRTEIKNTATQTLLCDTAWYKTRLRKATDQEWSLLPRQFNGRESQRLQARVRPVKIDDSPAMLMSNLMYHNLAQGDGWLANDLSSAISVMEADDHVSLVTLFNSCSSGMVFNTVFTGTTTTEAEADQVLKHLEHAIHNVASGQVADNATLKQLLQL